MPQHTIDDYRFETGVYRPPSEGGSNSLLVRLTRNCPWNRCAFCAMYKTEKFELRPPAEIMRDIDAMAAIVRDLEKISAELGHPGKIVNEAAIELISRVPRLNYHEGFPMLYHWLLSGSRTAFLQDANSVIMKSDQLVEVLHYLRSTFPSIQRVTTYARSKTLMQKPEDELKAIRLAGLDRLHVGLETGDDELLNKIKKGVTSDGHIKGGQKAMSAGFQLSEYWMPDLGGKSMWENHALNTARVLNAINPHYIRSRPFHPVPGTPLQAQIKDESFVMLSPDQQLRELKLMIGHLDVTSRVCFDHAGNYWKNRNRELLFSQSYEGYKFPEEKNKVLALIDEGLKTRNRRPNIVNL